MRDLHIDIETYSSIDLKSSGAYRYLESLDFEILLVAYAFDDGPVNIVDLAQGEELPKELIEALLDPEIRKCAHNATFERQAFKNFGIDVPINQWHCTLVQAAYCGLPLGLDQVSKILHLDESKAKLESGKALIRYFSMPCKPTKTNGQRSRNFPWHDLEKWEDYKTYCMHDVEAEREIDIRLSDYAPTNTEKLLYILDQKINDRGIRIDTDIAKKAYSLDQEYSKIIGDQIKEITGVDNPNSLAQLKEWLSEATGKEVKSLAKDQIPILIEEAENENVREVLYLRQKIAKSSIKKYTAMLNSVCSDTRAHGLFQFYGANRTGRWAGRLIQLQNLPRNYLSDLDLARTFTKAGNLEDLALLYEDVSDTLSQLIRTAFVAEEGKTFAVADFSAIEARVTAWLAGENWRLEVFKTHGKIYEASASMMFKIPMDQIGKGSDLRQKGKVAELALGYGGGVGALKTMGGEEMGLNESEMQTIIKKWRIANPNICQLWKDLEGCAKMAIKKQKSVRSKHKGLVFESNGKVLTIELPSGRKLFYCNPSVRKRLVSTGNKERWETESIVYMGMDQVRKQWTKIDTYGGKLTENVVQAIARDLLAQAMLNIDQAGFDIVMHVHDEIVCEVSSKSQKEKLEKMCNIMARKISWAKGLPLGADGYLTPYYKKD